MPASKVLWPNPLTRLNPWYPGQFGVPGAWSETGLRQHSTGAIFWVDPNCPWAEDQQDGTDPEHPMATITAALTKCQPYRGDTIAVMHNGAWIWASGTTDYDNPVTENVIVPATKPGIRIVGVAQSSSLGVPWRSATLRSVILTVNAIDVLIEGFCFRGLSAAGGPADCSGVLAQYGGGNYGDNFTLRHCFFDTGIQIAIQLEFVYNGEIYENCFQRCDIAGVYVDPAGLGISDCHIHHNWFHEVGLGQAGALSLQGAFQCKIDHNQVYNSNAQVGGAVLLATDEGIDTSLGDENIVHDNVLSCLLPGPGNDYSDFCNSAVSDAWITNQLMNGISVTNP